MLNIERQYEYKPKWTTILLCAVFFGLCAVILGAKAQFNNRGLIINGIIELSVYGATVFYWVLCCLSVGFVLIAGVLTIHRLKHQQRIAFTPSSLIVPKSRWSQEEQSIEYRRIKSLSTSKISGQRFLYVTHAEGKHIIVASMLSSKATFDEVCELLAKKIQGM